MLDKSIIIVLIFVILSGGLAYEQYARARGEIGPVGRLLDFVGFADFSEDSTRTDHAEVHKTYQVDYNTRLAGLREKYIQIETERAKFIEKRREMLLQLLELNDQFKQDALMYAQQIEEEKVNFLANFPKLQQSLTETVRELETLSEEDRAAVVKEMRAKINNLFDQLEIPSSSKQEIDNAFNSFEDLIAQQDQGNFSQCGGEFEACLEKNADQLQQTLNGFMESIVGQKDKGMNPMLKTADQLEREYDVVMENAEGTELMYQKSNEEIESEFQELSQELVSYTDDEFQKLMEMFQELYDEQQMLFTNLQLSHQRIKGAHRRADADIQTALKRAVNPLVAVKISTLSNKYNQKKRERDAIVKEVDVSVDKIQKLAARRWNENRAFIAKTQKSLQQEYQKLMLARKNAEKRNSFNWQFWKKQKADPSEDLERLSLKRADLATQRASMLDKNNQQLDQHRINIKDQRLRLQDKVNRMRQQQMVGGQSDNVKEQIRRFKQKAMEQGY